MRTLVCTALLAGLVPLAAAQTAPKRTHIEVVNFVVSSGLSVCESSEGAPTEEAKARGAIAKHELEVANDCESANHKDPTVVFAFEFDTGANRDAAVADFVKQYQAEYIDWGTAGTLGERGAIFVAGPARADVSEKLRAQFARQQASGKD